MTRTFAATIFGSPINRFDSRGQLLALKLKAQLPLEEKFLKFLGNPLLLRPEESTTVQKSRKNETNMTKFLFLFLFLRQGFLNLMFLYCFYTVSLWVVYRFQRRTRWFWSCWALNPLPALLRVMPKRAWSCHEKSQGRGGSVGSSLMKHPKMGLEIDVKAYYFGWSFWWFLNSHFGGNTAPQGMCSSLVANQRWRLMHNSTVIWYVWPASLVPWRGRYTCCNKKRGTVALLN